MDFSPPYGTEEIKGSPQQAKLQDEVKNKGHDPDRHNIKYHSWHI
jgi:hypothetical protein